MCKVSSQVLREPKAKNWPVKVFRKPQSLISEGHEKFSANRTCSGVCRVPCLRYLCRIKVEDDNKRMKSEVEIRNGNGKIDKIKCKISTAGKSEDVSSIRIAILLYSCQYIYTYCRMADSKNSLLFSLCCYMISYRRTNKRESGRADFLDCAKKTKAIFNTKTATMLKKGSENVNIRVSFF